MNAFLRPGAALMGRLRFKGKFGVMALIVLLPIAAMLVLLWIETQQDVAVAKAIALPCTARSAFTSPRRSGPRSACRTSSTTGRR
jgi:hypothetical protein